MAFDISRLFFRSLRGLKPTGIDVVTIRYINNYSKNASFLIQRRGFFFFFSEIFSEEIAILLSERPKNIIFKMIKFAALSIATNLKKKRFNYIINLGHTGLENEEYFKKSKKYAEKILVLLHDLIPIRNPEFCTAKQSLVHKKRIINSINFSDKIMTISKYVRNDILDFIKENNLKFNDKIRVLYLGSSFEGKSSEHFKQSHKFSNYHLMIGTVEGRKKYDFILKFLLKGMNKNTPFKKLVIVGQKGWKDEKFLNLLKNNDLDKRLALLDNCEDDELIELYKNSRGIIFASDAEGFGLPIIDAVFFKKPILANNLGVFREIAGNYPYYFDNKSYESFKKSLQLSETFEYDYREKVSLPMWGEHFKIFEKIINLNTND